MSDAAAPSMQDRMQQAHALVPGLIATIVVALAATYLSDHYNAPSMVFALLLGMALNTLPGEPRYAPGIILSARTLLRISVALLGLRITFAQVGELGWSTAAMVVCAVPLTIGFGWILSKLTGVGGRFGVLSGGAVGICGASAAMAIAAAWPRKDSERDTVVVIACITSLSTMAMLAYPAVGGWLGLDPVAAGRFFGGSIHDVAQVVGAGYSQSPQTGDTATVVKLMRVAMLLPVVVAITLLAARGRKAGDGEAKVTPLPGFLIGFVVLAFLNGMGWVPGAVSGLLTEVSRWLLLISVAALGMKTSAKDIMEVGRTAIILVVAETAFIALFVLGWIELVG
ncbi:YeiH family protein [Niveispirillum sp. KHB5.9]|uniref:YeiH family protein n=1 Tax=Niveispirillum sp. KHB5.9 TaxID=3400269 RepID=UPI003A8B2945